MAIHVSNQKPAVLDPLHLISCTGTYDPMPAIQATLVDPLLQPLEPVQPSQHHQRRRCRHHRRHLRPHPQLPGRHLVAPASEQAAKELFGQTPVNFHQKTSLPIGEAFATQAGARNKLPPPGPTVLYTAGADVIPAAKGLPRRLGRRERLLRLTGLHLPPRDPRVLVPVQRGVRRVQGPAHAADPDTQLLPADTAKLLADFSQLHLKALTESLLIRKDDGDENHEHSFARIIIHMLDAVHHPAAAGRDTEQHQPHHGRPTVHHR